MEAYLLNYSVKKFYSKEKLPKFCIVATAMEGDGAVQVDKLRLKPTL